MPIFNLECSKCSEPTRRFLHHLTGEEVCPKCDGKLVRVGTGPTSRIVEVRDNGLMPRKVEQLADIDELIKNR